MNNALFAILLLLGVGLTVILQWKPMKDVSMTQKWVFGVMVALNVGLFALYSLGADWPMPAQLFSDWISPHVERLVKGGIK